MYISLQTASPVPPPHTHKNHQPMLSKATGTEHTNTPLVLSVLHEACRLLYVVSRFNETSTYCLTAR